MNACRPDATQAVGTVWGGCGYAGDQVGVTTAWASSDMSPCGATRTGPSGASVPGGIAVRRFDGCGLAGAAHERLV